MHGTNTSNDGLTSSYANASASSSKVTLESKDDKRILRKPSRGKLLPWSRRGKKSASAEHVKDGPEEEIGFRDHPIYGGSSLSASPGGSEEALETQLERLMIPPPWPCEDRPENCPSITSVPTYKNSVFYRLHSPSGPPYYINHLLRPPNSTALFAARSPASAFSNSFPPLAPLPPGSPPLRTVTLSLRAPPLQANVSLTPDPSTNIAFAGASDVSYFNRYNYTAVGNPSADVDHLDVSNPWGQKFHHDSPYDLGQKKGKKPMRPGGPSASTSVTDLRSRLPSHSRFSRPTTPSPLSRSTPAVNIQPERKEGFGPRRKLSKRKPSGLQAPPTASASPDSSSDSQHSTSSPIDGHVPESAVSMASTAVPPDIPSAEGVNSTPLSPELTRKLSKRRPIYFHSASSGYISPPEKNKGGVFGRMAKRFSFGMGGFMSGGKRGMTFERRLGHKGSMSLTDVSFNGRLNRPQNDPPTVMRNELPPPLRQESPKQGPKRIPPPSLEELAPASSISVSQTSTSIRKSIVAPTPGSSVAPQLPNIVSDASFVFMSQQFQEGAIRDSLVSTDTEPDWSLGKLTIANPDMVGGSDTDTSFRGKGNNLMSTSRPGLSNRPPLVDPDPRASIRVEVDSCSSFQDLGDRNSRAFTTESRTPTQEPTPLQQQRSPVPPPPPKEERISVVINGTPITQNLRVSVTESSVTATSRPSSRASSPDLPPTPPNFVPPPPISKNTEVPLQAILSAQDGSPNRPITSDRSNLSNADIPSPTKPRPNGRQERVYIVDVPVDGSLFVRSAPDGTSVPPVEKPELPPLPPKSEPQSAPAPAPPPPSATPSSSRQQSKDQKETTPPPSPYVSAPAPSSSRQQPKDRKETTIFASLFNTPPRGRHNSESPSADGSSHDHGSQMSPSVARRRTKPSSPDKSSSAVGMRTDSPEKDSHGDRVKDRDYHGSRRGDRRSYLEKRDDHRDITTLRDVHNGSHSEGAEQRERERRQEHEERQIRERNQEKERQRQRLKEEDERVARKRREREEEEIRANRAKEQEEEERRERKARERDEEQRRLRRAKEREEEEAMLRRIKQKEEEKRRVKEDEERRVRKAREKEEEERRIRREKERAEEERRVRREREEQERKARKVKEEEERRKAIEEEERRRAEEEERARTEERRKVEEERRKRREEEERRARREEEEKRRARKEEEERRARKEEEERRARKEEEERRARKEEEERKARKEEEDRRARKEEEERRTRKDEEERRARKEEEERRARKEEEERVMKEEEDRRVRKEAQERSVRKQREKEELQRAARKEKERLEAEQERERKERRALEREAIRQREWELEQRHQQGHSWSQETMRSFRSVSGDRPATSSYPSIYSSTVGYDWEPVEQRPRRKQLSYDSHDSGRQARSRKEPARLPDFNRRVELGIYPPGSSSHPSSHFFRPRAVSLESASQPPTPPRKEKEYTLRRQQINGGHAVYPSMTVDDTIFARPPSRAPARPVSGFPSPDVFKAREAWEHDRIWRGQSMSFDTGSAVSGPLPPASWTDLHSYSYEESIPPSVSYYSPPPPGSSYTSFMVQPSWSYPHYQTAAPPPPIEPFSIPPSSNPLPPPPRQSNYQFQSPS